MIDLNGTFDDAMNAVAERLLLCRAKQADAASNVVAANSARQSLGVLGADPATIDGAIKRLRSDLNSDTTAVNLVRGAVPGAAAQFLNIPSSVGAAIGQGRGDEAAAQLDILGLKNLNPWSAYASPATAAASLGLGAGTAALRQHIAKNLRDRFNVYHADPKAVAATMFDGASQHYNWWRAQPANAAAENSWLSKARDAIFGMPAADIPAGTMDQFRSAATSAAEAKKKPDAAAKVPPGRGLGRLATMAALPTAAAMLPLLYREWAGGGYRSGEVPARQLVDANLPATSEWGSTQRRIWQQTPPRTNRTEKPQPASQPEATGKL